MSWFEFTQNVIDGKYHCNEWLCSHILIEADCCEDANSFMESIGVCFEEDYGYESSICRWYRAYSHINFPSRWDNNLLFNEPEEYCEYLHKRYKHVRKHHTNPHSRIFRRNNEIKEIGVV